MRVLVAEPLAREGLEQLRAEHRVDVRTDLTRDEFLAALPGDTPEDFRMKTQVRKNCTGCHSASYPLQHRFDEEGWSKILDLMKQVNVNVRGVRVPEEPGAGPENAEDSHQGAAEDEARL